LKLQKLLKLQREGYFIYTNYTLIFFLFQFQDTRAEHLQHFQAFEAFQYFERNFDALAIFYFEYFDTIVDTYW
jgi:hypothetical protein